MVPAILSLLVLGVQPALAFEPSELRPQELGVLASLDQAPQRVMRFHPGKQATLAKQAPWQRFLSTEGAGWQARFDERTGLPYRAWGRGIELDLPAGADAALVEARVRAVLADHPGLLGLDVDELVLGRAGRVERTDTWYLRLDQAHQGVPVYRGSVEVRVRFGKIIMLGVKTHPELPALGTPQLSEETAREVAIELGPLPGHEHQPGSAQLVVLPFHRGSGLDYALAWEVRSETWAPRAKWVSWIDAQSGELLAVQDELMRAERTLYATHDVRTINGEMETSLLPYAPVWSDAGTAAYTDASGVVNLDGDDFTSELMGEYFRVYNNTGAEGELAFEGFEGTWTDASADQSEIDSYVFLHHVRDWALEFAPENPISGYQLTSYVNVRDAVCNAWFDGNFNFGPEDSSNGCNSTARIADVNYHEWGHGFHYWGLQSGYFDSTSSEGIADTISVLQTGDSTIAPYFWIGYRQGIRDVSDMHVYPDDVVNESHEDGLIFGGSMWDLLGIMQRDFGDEEGWRLTSQLLADAVPAGFLITEAFDEFVAADDDDGDLSNGTPHYCQLLEAFTPHGLGPTGSTALVALAHEPLDNQPSTADGYPVSIAADDVSGDCFDVGFDSGRLWYSINDGGTWESVSLSTSGDALEGAIPAQAAGSVVLYYIDVDTDDGGDATVPSGGDINPFSFAVGELIEMYAEDFEASDGGYTHELLSGQDTEGADDWMWGTPIGAGGDPDFAYSGDMVWGNDLGGGNFNGQYQNEKLNQLSSPGIAVAPYNELLVQFQRWLHVEDGYYDQANVLVDDVKVWTNHATNQSSGDEHHQDLQWALASVMADDPDLDGLISLAWQIESDQGLYFAGWNIDDVAVYAPPTPRNLMTVLDFDASDGEPGLVLSWTNPSYDDLAELQVVYRADSWPIGHEDGQGVVVLHVDNPEPGQAVSHTVTDAPAGEGYYAIFAADSEGTWTRGGYEGYNADLGTPDAWNGEDDRPGVGGPSCGCSSSSSRGSGAALLLGLLGLVGLRRRR
jgi:MYXO-CTERM domain-containing protein